jgi:hypothetical protein
MTSPPPTGFAGPLKGALSVAWQSQFHDSRAAGHDAAYSGQQGIAR